MIVVQTESVWCVSILYISAIVQEEFTKNDLAPTDSKFTAHITLFKLSAQKKWGEYSTTM